MRSCLRILCTHFYSSGQFGCASGTLFQIARKQIVFSTPEIEDSVSVSLLEIEDSAQSTFRFDTETSSQHLDKMR